MVVLSSRPPGDQVDGPSLLLSAHSRFSSPSSSSVLVRLLPAESFCPPCLPWMCVSGSMVGFQLVTSSLTHHSSLPVAVEGVQEHRRPKDAHILVCSDLLIGYSFSSLFVQRQSDEWCHSGMKDRRTKTVQGMLGNKSWDSGRFVIGSLHSNHNYKLHQEE